MTDTANTPPVALVTGAGSGIGAAAAGALARDGHRVAYLDRAFGAAERERIAAAGHLALDGDVASETDVRRAVDRVIAEWGAIDCLVNCAGVMCIAPAAEISADRWNATLAVNAGGALACAQAAFEALRASPRAAIVNVTSISHLRGQPGLVAYAASKAALESVTRTLAVEWAPHAVRVNAVAPGHVMTPMVEAALADGSLPRGDLEGWEARIPLGNRLATPAEVGDAIAYLAGPGASYVTGQTLVVDGALTINGTYRA